MVEQYKLETGICVFCFSIYSDFNIGNVYNRQNGWLLYEVDQKQYIENNKVGSLRRPHPSRKGRCRTFALSAPAAASVRQQHDTQKKEHDEVQRAAPVSHILQMEAPPRGDLASLPVMETVWHHKQAMAYAGGNFCHEKGNFSRNDIIFQFVRADKRFDGLWGTALPGMEACMGKPMMIARSCSVTFRDHIEFFDSLDRKSVV